MRDYFPISEMPISTNHKTSFSGHEEKEVVVAIPNGKKSYLWFCTNNQGEDACYLVPRNFKTQPEWSEISFLNLSLSESPKPFYGTLVSGTLVYLNHPSKNNQNSPEYFVADDMFYFQGISLSKSIFQERLQYLVTFFQQFMPSTSSLSSNSIPNSSIKKKLMFVLANMRGMKEYPQTPFYKIHHWQLRHLSNIAPYYALPDCPNPSAIPSGTSSSSSQLVPIETRTYVSRPTNDLPQKTEWIFQYQNPAYKQKAIFKIIPEEQCDVYSIYARLSNKPQTNPCEWVSCGYAGIFDYDTSKLLNYHCRNMQSNHLDQIEESDDEEDQPITPPTEKYFECSFSSKFRKWVPVSFIPQCSIENTICIDTLANPKSNKFHNPQKPNFRKYI
jgi:hypothetical protein